MSDSPKAKYYQENREERLRYQRNYYEENKESIRDKLRQKKEKDPAWVEKRKEYNREYYRNNRDRIQARRKSQSGK
jgi:hypothetical protein|tara:strand:- start:375 stop:602 length:228 start_codon:yes stop_codon:yes gene_type:complete